MKNKLKTLLIFLIPLFSVFGGQPVGVAIHDTTFVVGDVFNIPIYVDSSLTGKNVTSFSLQFSYNDSYLQVNSISTTGTISQSWGSAYYNANIDNRLNIAAAGTSSLSGTGILLYINMTAIRSGGTYFSFTDTTNNYFNEGDPRISFENAYFSVSAKPSINVSPNSGIITVGDSLQFNAYSGESPYTWSVTNSAVASINSDGLLTALTKGNVRVVAEDNRGIIDTCNGEVEVRSFSLSLRDTSFYKGQTIDIPIYVSDLTGLNITSGIFNIHLQQALLSPTEIITTGTLLQSYITPSFNVMNDDLKIAFAGTSPLTGAGKFLIIRFSINNISSSGSYLTLQNIVFNEDELGNGNQSYFRALNPAALSITPNTAELLAGDTLRFSVSNGTAPYTWGVSNPALASIDASGLLTALQGGVTKVSVGDVYGGSGLSNDIYIYDNEVAINDTSGPAGEAIDIPIYVNNLSPSHSIISLQGDILFDSSKIKFGELITTGMKTSGWSFQLNDLGNKIILAGAGANGFNTSGIMLKIRFNISPNVNVGNYSNINIQNFIFNEGTPIPKINDGRITVTSGNIPSDPTNLVLTGSTESSILFQWTDNSSNESGFKIERSLDSPGSWSEISTASANTTSYNDTGLLDGRHYYYRVRAYNSSGNSNYSNELYSEIPLASPTNLNGSLITSNKLELTWMDHSLNESGFYIERKDGASASFIQIAVNPANALTYVDSNLIYGTTYFYKVKAYNSVFSSDYSNTFEITINDVIPDSPSNLTASTIDFSRIDISWNDNSSNELGFELESKIGTAGFWSTVDFLIPNSTAFSDTGLIDGTKYFYKISAYNSSGASAFSNVDSAITDLLPPVNLAGSVVIPNKIDLSWVDESEAELGFIIERKDSTDGTYSVLDSVAANIDSYTDSLLIANKSYTYRVKAYNELLESSYSNEFFIVFTGIDKNELIPTENNLGQNYPNPFNPTTVIRYQIAKSGFVSLKVYDLTGEEIAVLINKYINAGVYTSRFDASKLASGIYVYRMIAGEFIQTKKMLLIK